MIFIENFTLLLTENYSLYDLKRQNSGLGREIFHQFKNIFSIAIVLIAAECVSNYATVQRRLGNSSRKDSWVVIQVFYILSSCIATSSTRYAHDCQQRGRESTRVTRRVLYPGQKLAATIVAIIRSAQS